MITHTYADKVDSGERGSFFASFMRMSLCAIGLCETFVTSSRQTHNGTCYTAAISGNYLRVSGRSAQRRAFNAQREVTYNYTSEMQDLMSPRIARRRRVLP